MEHAFSAVLQKTELPPELATETVKGFDFNSIKENNGQIDYNGLMNSYKYIGFQANSLGLAIEEVNRMINWRLSDDPIAEDEIEEYKDPEVRKNTKCTIFLGYTSNLISCGIREFIRFVVEHSMVNCLVTTAGGVEEDFIKCFAPTYLGDFHLPGKQLRMKGINRTGNLLVPNDNYCKFEDWIMPIFEKMLEEQKQGTYWTPSKMIARLGKEINHPDSVYYWAYKNNIPVFCPALTDGSLGDMIYFFNYRHPDDPLRVDIAEDLKNVNNIAVFAKKTGMIILGGGIIKHHICNANLMRNGADFAVFINTAHEFDGSDSGARPDEAISWGKIKLNAKPVKVYSDVSLVFPILVAQTFAQKYAKECQQNKKQ